MSDITIAAAIIAAAVVLFEGHGLRVVGVAGGRGRLRRTTGASSLLSRPSGYRDPAVVFIATMSGMNAAFGQTVPSLPDCP